MKQGVQLKERAACYTGEQKTIGLALSDPEQAVAGGPARCGR